MADIGREASKVGFVAVHLADLAGGKLFPEVLKERPAKARLWQADLLAFSGWRERDDEV